MNLRSVKTVECVIIALLVCAFENPAVAQPLSEMAVLRAPDGSLGDEFGTRAVIQGEIALVGAWLEDDACPTDVNCNSGAVYAYRRDLGGPNAWGQLRKITASDKSRNGLFGYGLALEGNTAAVGAYASEEGKGAVYVFDRNAGGPDRWGEVAKLTHPDGGFFGTDVALLGDLLIVSAPADPYLCPSTPNICIIGSVYIFRRVNSAATEWTLLKRLRAPDAEQGHIFGHSLDISGDTLVIGAPGARPNGAIYIYKRNLGGPDAWGLLGRRDPSLDLSPDGSSSSSLLGRWPDGVDVSGDLIAAGGPIDSRGCTSPAYFCGSTHVFSRNHGGVDAWGELKILVSPQPAHQGFYGTAVALAGELLVVSENGGHDLGAIYVYNRHQGGPNNFGIIRELIPSDRPEGWSWLFGSTLNTDGSSIIAGAQLSDQACSQDPHCNSGSAYIYDIIQLTGQCAAGDSALCLNDSRFRVEVNWRTAKASGSGHAISITPDTGLFWFFDSTNVEVMLKVLDGCALNDHFWIFAAGLTNVEVEIAVTDVRTGERKIYKNPTGRPFTPIQDTVAFACP